MPGRLLAIWLQSTALMRRNHTKQTLNAFSLFEHHRSSSSTTTITKDPRKKKGKKTEDDWPGEEELATTTFTCGSA